MSVATDKCMARVRVRDANGDDVKAIKIKKNKKIKHMSNVYEDFYKPKANLDLFINSILVRVMLNPL